MTNAAVNFTHMIQDSQEFGGNDERIISRVFFSLTVKNKSYPGLYANIKQTIGSAGMNAPLEVSNPIVYEGPLNYQAFRDAVERYHRSRIGPQGRGIRIGAGAISNLRMRNNTFRGPHTEEFEVEADNKAW